MTVASALLAGFDAGSLAGTTVFTRGYDSIAIPALASMYDRGRYQDALQFLFGYGSQSPRKLTTEANTLWVFGGSAGAMTLGIDDSDRVYCHSSGDTFTLTAPAGNAWGWPTGATAASASGSGWRVTATRAWTRGNVDVHTSGDHVFSVNPDGSPAAFDLPTYTGTIHSVPTALRGAEGDTDDQTANCLEYWDNVTATSDTTLRRIRWGITAAGHTYCSWPTAVVDITWPATAAGQAFRLALGFTGAETVVTSAGQDVVTSTYPNPRVLVALYGFTMLEAELGERSASTELADGDVRGRLISSPVEFEARFNGTGPLHTSSQEGHALRSIGPALSKGARASILPVWGDPRRGRHVHQQLTGDAPTLFSASVTTELDGLLGRRIGRVSPANGDAWRFSYGQGLRLRWPRAFILRESP
jgi:hypothetical protein